MTGGSDMAVVTSITMTANRRAIVLQCDKVKMNFIKSFFLFYFYFNFNFLLIIYLTLFLT